MRASLAWKWTILSPNSRMHRAASMLGIGMKGIWIVAEPRDGDTRLSHEIAHPRHGAVIDLRHVQVRDPRVTPIRLARRPAHELDARKPLVRGDGKDLFER